jgi:hypothetical protein
MPPVRRYVVYSTIRPQSERVRKITCASPAHPSRIVRAGLCSLAQLAQAMRKKLCSVAGRRVYGRRKALVEPVFGVLKQLRGGCGNSAPEDGSEWRQNSRSRRLLTIGRGCLPGGSLCDQPPGPERIARRTKPSKSQCVFVAKTRSHAHTLSAGKSGANQSSPEEPAPSAHGPLAHRNP